MPTNLQKQRYNSTSPPPSFSPTPRSNALHSDRSLESPRRSSSRSQATTTDTMEYTTYLLTTIQNNLSKLDGRDKGMKIIQYAIKILLYYQRVDTKRWSPMVSHLSQTRKILRIGNWIAKVEELKLLYNEPPSPSPHKLPDHIVRWCSSFIALVNRLADDLFCFYKIGVLGPWIGKRAERIAIYCWFLTIWIDLKSNIITLSTLSQLADTSTTGYQNHHQEKKLLSTKISCAKLSMDAIFCACDILKPTYSLGIQEWSGFISGCLAGYKIWFID